MDNNLISNKELIEMGYRPHTANDIIHQARELLVSRGYTSVSYTHLRRNYHWEQLSFRQTSM